MSILKRSYDIQAEEVAAIRKRLEIMFDLADEQFGVHSLIVGMTMMAIVADRNGREALDDLIDLARSMRQTLINEEKAEAKAAREAARRWIDG